MKRLCLLSALALLAGCADRALAPLGAGKPAVMAIVSGDAQQGVVATALKDPVVVVVEDALGRPVKGQIVNFKVVSGGGDVFAGAGITDDLGRARDEWTLGESTAFEQRLEARAVDPATGEKLVFAVFSAEPKAAAPAGAEAAGGGYSGSANGPVADSLALEVHDKYGNPVPEVQVSWWAGQGSVSPATSATGKDGVARTRWTLGPQAGTQRASGRPAGLAPVEFEAAATAGAPDRLVIDVPAAGAYTDDPFETQPRVRVVDAYGNTVSIPDTVAARVSAGGLLVGMRPVRPVSGVATFAGMGVTGPPGTYWLVYHTSNAVAPDSQQLEVAGPATAVRQLAVGWARACGLSGGDALCWNGGASEPVPGGLKFRLLAAGFARACGLTDAGEAWCWTIQDAGSPGRPERVPGAPALDTLAAGTELACGLARGKAWCWGLPAPAEALPVAARASDMQFSQVTAGGYHACGVAAGQLWCWGGNQWGQLGDGTTETRASPVRVPGAWATASGGDGSTCALDTAGAAWCWGLNNVGQLGQGYADGGLAPKPHPSPLAVAGGPWDALGSAGASRSMCALAAHLAWCWGENGRGELGDGTAENRSLPTRVKTARLFSALSVAPLSGCGVTPGGRGFCWAGAEQVPRP